MNERVVGWVDGCTQTLGCSEVLDQHLPQKEAMRSARSLFWWIVILNSKQLPEYLLLQFRTVSSGNRELLCLAVPYYIPSHWI